MINIIEEVKMKRTTLIIIIVCTLVIIGFQSCEKTTSPTTQKSAVKEEAASTRTPAQEKIDVSHDYKIVKTEEISFGNVKRYQIDVVTDSSDGLALKQISGKVIEEFKTKKRFNAVVVFFYDYEEFIGHGYTLAKTTYAPYGKWENAMDVSTGDYKNMEFSFEIKQKNLEYKLTPDEATIVKQWYEAYTLLDTNPNELVEDKTVSAYVAKQNNISSDQVNEILNRWLMWQI